MYYTNLENVIKDSIKQFPTLNLFPDYQSSRIRVLNHLFLVIGNGAQWANGGYMFYAEYFKNGNTKKPPKYKKEKPLDIDYMFKNPLVRICSGPLSNFKFKDLYLTLDEYNSHPDKDKWENELLSEAEIPKYIGKCSHFKYYVVKNVVKENIEMANFTHIIKKESIPTSKYYNWQPYPHFEEHCSPLYEDDNSPLCNDIPIRNDWKNGIIEVLTESLEFFNDEERVKYYHWYPTDQKIEDFKQYVLRRKMNVNKAYEVTCFTGENYEEAYWERWNNILIKSKKYINDTIEKLNSKETL